MTYRLKESLKALFRYLRSVDNMLIHILRVRSSYSPKALPKDYDLNIFSLREFDRAAFADYSKNAREPLILKVYKRLRRIVFLGAYRAYKRFSR